MFPASFGASGWSPASVLVLSQTTSSLHFCTAGMIPFTKIPSAATLHPTPFNVAIPDKALLDLKKLLELSPLAPETYEGAQQDRRFGITTEWLRNAKDCWMNHFDWRKPEKHINSFPHFTAPIVDDDGRYYTIHFVAIFSDNVDAIPIVFLHGWPGSFLEFLPILRILQNTYTPATLPYHIIVPSLPGYTFSSPPPLDKDFTTSDVARLLDKLLIGLGFGAGYIAQGGDIGSRIARLLAAESTSCKAIHLNVIMMTRPASAEDDSELTEEEREGLARGAEFARTGSGYAVEQGTRPSTIGHVLSSSPLALLAWIGEKFLTWTDVDPPIDTILESATLYWVTQTLPRSIYHYRQRFAPVNVDDHGNQNWPIYKPLGFSSFPYEIAPVPKTWVATMGDLVFWRQHTNGGHFAALEQPKVLLKDVEDFVAQVWPVKSEQPSKSEGETWQLV